MRASTRERIRPARSPPRPPARRAPIARSAPGRDRAHGTRRVVFPAWPDVHTRERAAAPWGRGQSLPTGGRVGIRGVLIWQATLTGLFLLLVGGGLGLPLPEDLTLLAAGVLAHQHVLRLRDVIAVGFAGVVCADWIIYLAGWRYGQGIVALPVLSRLFGAARLDAVRSAVERYIGGGRGGEDQAKLPHVSRAAALRPEVPCPSSREAATRSPDRSTTGSPRPGRACRPPTSSSPWT